MKSVENKRKRTRTTQKTNPRTMKTSIFVYT